MNKNLILWLVVGYVVLGALVLIPARNGIDAATGRVWNAIDTGADKIAALQGQTEFAADIAADYVEDIAAARNDIIAARSTGDLNGALEALGNANSALVSLNAVAEDNPDIINLTTQFQGLMDETAGAFNRVSTERGRLIDAQLSFNNTCYLFYPVCLVVGGPREILGSNTDPTADMDIAPMGDR